MPVHFATTSAMSSGVTSSVSSFSPRCSAASLSSDFAYLALERGKRAVLELGRLPVVGGALGLLDLVAQVLELGLLLADRPGSRPSPAAISSAGLRTTSFRSRELLLESREAFLAGLVALLLQCFALDLELADAPVDLVELGGHRVDLHAQLRGGLVDQVDGLVGQEAIGDVAGRQRRGRDERRVLDADAVMHFVALAQSAQDRDGVLDRGLADVHRLEAPLESGVLLDVLAVLVERRRADRVQLAAREHRLQHVRRVDRAFRRAGTDDGVELVDEQDDLALARGDLFEDGLESLLELAAVLRAGEERTDVRARRCACP